MEERSDIIEKYKKKIESLKKHNNFYYIKDKPKISDSDYDNLKKEIIILEKKYSFLKKFGSVNQIIGAPPSNKFLKIKQGLCTYIVKIQSQIFQKNQTSRKFSKYLLIIIISPPGCFFKEKTFFFIKLRNGFLK